MALDFLDTYFIGQSNLIVEQLESTNGYLKACCETSKMSEGFLVWAISQTDGRGQALNKWFSGGPNENLAFSFLLTPKFLNASNSFRLNMAVSVGIINGLAQQLPNLDFKIKWPNDIYVNEKKVAGILIENQITQLNLSSSIIGIGLNVNTKEFPAELFRATSLCNEQGDANISTEVVLSSLLKNIESCYLQLRSGNWEPIKRRYTQSLLFYQEIQNYKNTKTEEFFSGQIMGVNETGELIVLVENSLTYWTNKTIAFLFQNK
jgi:BirA family biotin operon repressor/biotin-[acetyl-CoA-carboxylase] ligase